MNSYDANHVWSHGVPLRHHGPVDAVVMEDVEIFGVTVPKGYRTDGASAPRLAFWVVAPFTIALLAALVHDLRYDPVPDIDGVKRRALTRKEADKEFYENLKATGMSRSRRWAAYTAVRAGGWKPWNAGTKRGTLNVGDY